jgi:hypothetical protein
MVVRGKVKNGKVVLDDPAALPEGTTVEVRPLRRRKPATKPRKTKQAPRSLADRLRSVIGKAKNLPPDASLNHDYYSYGLPKKDGGRSSLEYS